MKAATNLLFLAAGWTAFVLVGPSWWQLAVAAFLAAAFTQTAFLGHDAGHQQISGSKRVNVLLGRLHGNLWVGLGYGWWVARHNRHHAHPNQVGRDPDIATGAIAFTRENAQARGALGESLARRQAWLFFPMLLEGGSTMPRPNLRRAQAHVRAFCAHTTPSPARRASPAPTPRYCVTCTRSAVPCARNWSTDRGRCDTRKGRFDEARDEGPRHGLGRAVQPQWLGAPL